MFNKGLSTLLAALIVLTPVQSYAEESALDGRVTALSSGQSAPYEGILLDSIAASKMLVDRKYIRLEIELDLRKEFQKDLAEKSMAYDLLQVEHESSKRIYESTIKMREDEISNLNEMLKDEMNDYSEWWMIAGVAVGILLSVTVFYASVEVAR